MWKAIEHAAKLVENGGYFYFTIYNKVAGFKGSNFWLKVKKLYNAAPRIIKVGIEILFILNDIAGFSIRFQNPIKVIRTYKKRRGMDYRVDIIDWLGGYPYEFATVSEIFKFMKKKFPAFKIVNVKQRHDLGNNWFLFKKISS
jgi:2-polyprenyl-6-hydroxyphenyl methylase/3-demethylubiquinone-9 3-methyltransferase